MNGPRGARPARALVLIGAGGLAVSLFLTWSHQLGALERSRFHGSDLLGVPADPTAWQVYATAAEVLAALALALAAAALWGGAVARATSLGAGVLGVLFVLRAHAHAPTDGLLLARGSGASARYVTDPATPGPGETVAVIALILALVGLALGLILDLVGDTAGKRRGSSGGGVMPWGGAAPPGASMD